MLSELNEIAKNHEYLIEAFGAFLPFLITIFMAFIAYQQWQINKRLHNMEIKKDVSENLSKPIMKKIEEISSIISEKEENSDSKQDRIINIISEIQAICDKNNHHFETPDYKLLKKALSELSEWVLATKKYKPSWEEIKYSYRKVVRCLSCMHPLYELGMSLDTNKPITIYAVVRDVVLGFYKFLVPLCLQQHIKAWFYPKWLHAIIIFLVVGIVWSMLGVFKMKIPIRIILFPFKIILVIALITWAVFEVFKTKKSEPNTEEKKQDVKSKDQSAAIIEAEIVGT